MAFAWALHCPSQRLLSSYTAGFQSMTTDMGVELSLADFQCERPEFLLPEWVTRGGLEMDVDDAASGTEGSVDAPVDGVEMPPTPDGDIACERESVASDMGSAAAVEEAAAADIGGGHEAEKEGQEEEQERDAAEAAEARHDMQHHLMPFCLT
eukprot:12978714-Heterocapsa_arctica.AAC.1